MHHQLELDDFGAVGRGLLMWVDERRRDQIDVLARQFGDVVGGR
jgi:hypothetical protein